MKKLIVSDSRCNVVSVNKEERNHEQKELEMGWHGNTDWKTITDVKNYLVRSWTGNVYKDNRVSKVLQASTVGNSIHFAIEISDGDDRVVYYSRVAAFRDNGSYSYKEVGYSMDDITAPISLIKKLSETDDDHENEWRKACVDRAEKMSFLNRLFNDGKKITVNTENFVEGGKVDDVYIPTKAKLISKNNRVVRRNLWVSEDRGTYLPKSDIVNTGFSEYK